MHAPGPILTSVTPVVARDLFTALLTLVALGYAFDLGPSQQPASANNTSANVPAPSPADPATVTFTTDVGLVLHAVKPASVADYENAMTALQEALATSTEEETRKVASGWRVFKVTETDASSNVLYVHLLQPAVAGVDYRPSLWLDKLLEGAPPELLAKYRDAFAAPPSKLGLTEFANMTVAPVKPGNASPSNASPVKPPGA